MTETIALGGAWRSCRGPHEREWREHDERRLCLAMASIQRRSRLHCGQDPRHCDEWNCCQTKTRGDSEFARFGDDR